MCQLPSAKTQGRFPRRSILPVAANTGSPSVTRYVPPVVDAFARALSVPGMSPQSASTIRQNRPNCDIRGKDPPLNHPPKSSTLHYVSGLVPQKTTTPCTVSAPIITNASADQRKPHMAHRHPRRERTERTKRPPRSRPMNTSPMLTQTRPPSIIRLRLPVKIMELATQQ